MLARLAETKEHCPFCKENFVGRPKEWRKHIKLHLCGDPDNPSIRCLICGFVPKINPPSVPPHFQRCLAKSKDPTIFVCDDCNSGFKDKNRLRIHGYRSHGPLPFACDLCSKRFASYVGLDAHKLSCAQFLHRARDVTPSVCKICSKQVQSRVSFQTHFQQCLAKSEDPTLFVCDDCNRSFKDKNRLRVHRYRFHEPLPFACDLCTKRYALAVGLDAHRVFMHRAPDHVTGAPGVCKICSKQVQCLKQHMTVHWDKITCDDCNGVFSNKLTLAGHVGLHLSEKKRPYECKICQKRFSNQTVKWRHELCHSSPFVCSVCGLSFTQMGSMQIHKRLHLPLHKRPFACVNCGERFTTKWYKMQHEKKCDMEIEY